MEPVYNPRGNLYHVTSFSQLRELADCNKIYLYLHPGALVFSPVRVIPYKVPPAPYEDLGVQCAVENSTGAMIVTVDKEVRSFIYKERYDNPNPPKDLYLLDPNPDDECQKFITLFKE
jgi:hypothetical protein